MYRAPTLSDLEQIKEIFRNIDLFDDEEINYMDNAITKWINDPTELSWRVIEEDNQVKAVGYYISEELALGVYNILFLGVNKKYQKNGYGTSLVKSILEELKDQRMVIVETSGLESFKHVRNFYTKLGFKKVATIPEYYSEGDDKVIFTKDID